MSDNPVNPPDQGDVIKATFPVEVVALPYNVRAVFTPPFWGVRQMLGFIEKYNPPPPDPTDFNPPTGGTPAAARNLLPFRRKTNAQARRVYAPSVVPMRKAA